MNEIERFIRAVRRRLLIIEWLRIKLYCGAIIGLLLFIYSVSNACLNFPLKFIKSFYAVVFLVVIAAVAYFVRILTHLFDDKAVITAVQKSLPQLKDSLLSAWELKRNKYANVSTTLIGRHIEDVSDVVSDRLLPAQTAPMRTLLYSAGTYLLSLFLLLALCMFPFTRHSLVQVVVSPWAKPSMVAAKPALPPSPPVAGNFVITCSYPAYTGLEPVKTEDNPNISCLDGSVVKINARVSKPVSYAEISTSYGLTAPVRIEGNNNISCEFALKHSGTYKLLVKATDGTVDSDPPEYSINVTPDQPPAADILSPEADIVAANDATIAVVAQLSDDYGISRAELVCRMDDEKVARFPMTVAKGSMDTVSDYLLKISELGLSGGKNARLYVRVWDNDTVNGPKYGVSQALTVAITDFSVGHGKIEDAIKVLRESLVDLLADQLSAKAELDDIMQSCSTDTLRGVISAQKKIRQKIDEPIKMLDALLERMNNDPMTDVATYHEYAGLSEQLKDIRNRLADDVVNQLENNQQNFASRDQHEMAAGLEKISALSQNIWQYQRMRDLTNTGSKLSEAVSTLLSRINANAKPKELEKALNDIAGMFNSVARQLQKLPQELPEDFVNKPGIKQLDLSATSDLLASLNEAVSKGDWNTAQMLARRLKKQSEDLMDALQSAAKDVGFSSDIADKMGESLRQAGHDLDNLISDQVKNVAEIGSVDGFRRDALFAKQTQMLVELESRQRFIEGLLKSNKSSVEQHLPNGAGQLRQCIDLMDKVVAEFAGRRVYHSQKFLEDISKLLQGFKNSTIDFPQLDNAVGQALSGENEILRILKTHAVINEMDAKSFSRSKECANKQEEASKKAVTVRRALEEFARKSTAIAPSAMISLDNASANMSEAARCLDKYDTPNGLQNASSSLDHLRDARNGITSAEKEMQEQSRGSGSGAGSTVQMAGKSGSAGVGGIYGAQSAHVRLPSADEYRAPRQFRQELLDGLKENYPKRYEKDIRDYFRRLAQ